MTVQIDFLKDFFSLSLPELYKKYASFSTSVHIDPTAIERQLLTEGRSNLVIDTRWKNDGHDTDGFYLIELERNQFEVFISERGMKVRPQIFTDFEKAVAAKLKLIIDEIDDRIHANQFLINGKKP